jgi:hypothetical protein
MTSRRQVLANRANAQASTGPKSATGKARSARNARRHGLNVSVLADPTLASEVEALADEIAGAIGSAGTGLRLYAQNVAEAQVDLARVRLARHRLLAMAYADPSYVSPAAVKREDAIDRLEARFARRGQKAPVDLAVLCLAPPDGVRKLAVVVSDLSRQLAVMDRYERQARSRRKTAIRAFTAAKKALAPIEAHEPAVSVGERR